MAIAGACRTITRVTDNQTTTVTILLCALGAVFEGVDLQVAGVAAAGIVQEFEPDPRHLGIFFSASTLGLCCGALLGGRLSDRIGRKRVLIAAVAVFGLFSLLSARFLDHVGAHLGAPADGVVGSAAPSPSLSR